MDLLITLLYLIFVFSAIILIVVVLLQEGRGGGFGGALGEGGQQTFGVGAQGINKFTGYMAVLFLGSAILIHIFTLRGEQGSVLPGVVPENTSTGASPGAGEPDDG